MEKLTPEYLAALQSQNLEALQPHESHNMRRFSDIPWGCWSCGACSCHHADILREPCQPDTRKRKP